MNRSTVLQPSPNVRYRIVDGEAVVVQQQDARVLNLNETGASILQAMDGTRTVDDIVDRLAQEYEVAPETLRADVLRFIDVLIGAKVIESAT